MNFRTHIFLVLGVSALLVGSCSSGTTATSNGGDESAKRAPEAPTELVGEWQCVVEDFAVNLFLFGDGKGVVQYCDAANADRRDIPIGVGFPLVATRDPTEHKVRLKLDTGTGSADGPDRFETLEMSYDASSSKMCGKLSPESDVRGCLTRKHQRLTSATVEFLTKQGIEVPTS